MTIEKLERVMWRLRASHPNKNRLKNNDLRKSIMQEIGTDPRTYYSNRRALMALGWIKAHGNKYIDITGLDITES